MGRQPCRHAEAIGGSLSISHPSNLGWIFQGKVNRRHATSICTTNPERTYNNVQTPATPRSRTQVSSHIIHDQRAGATFSQKLAVIPRRDQGTDPAGDANARGEACGLPPSPPPCCSTIFFTGSRLSTEQATSADATSSI